MSEKRFIRISVCGDWGVKDTEKDKVLFFGTTDEVIDTVELLNNLVDENEQLKHELLCRQLDKAPTKPVNCRCSTR